jgi:hypothetical protein
MSRVTLLETTSLDSFQSQHEPPPVSLTHPATSSQTEEFQLRCTGSRSRVFNGSLLCSAISYVPGNAFWYEISLYREVSGSLVAAIKRFTHDEAGIDLFRVFDAEDFDALVSILEGYEPANDIDASLVGVDDMSVSGSEVALRAVGLRLRIEESRRQYGDLVGEMLYQLAVN